MAYDRLFFFYFLETVVWQSVKRQGPWTRDCINTGSFINQESENWDIFTPSTQKKDLTRHEPLDFIVFVSFWWFLYLGATSINQSINLQPPVVTWVKFVIPLTNMCLQLFKINILLNICRLQCHILIIALGFRWLMIHQHSIASVLAKEGVMFIKSVHNAAASCPTTSAQMIVKNTQHSALWIRASICRPRWK